MQDHRGFVFERQNVKKLKMSPGSGGAGRHLSSEIGGRSKTQPRCVARLLNQDVTSSAINQELSVLGLVYFKYYRLKKRSHPTCMYGILAVHLTCLL